MEEKKEAKQVKLADEISELTGLGIEVQVSVTKDKDCIVLGVPSTGQIKVHGDSARPQTWAHKIEVTQRLLAEARAREDAAKKGATDGGK